MARGVDVAWAQIADQQLLAAKDGERQETPIAVVAMEVPAFLVAVHPGIGGIEVEDQFAGSFLERGDELVQQHFVEGHGGLSIHPLLQPAKAGVSRQRLRPFQSSLPGEVAPQGLMVIEVFIPQGQPVDALAQQTDLWMGDEERVAGIRQHGVQRADQAEPPIGLAQEEEDAAITGDVPAGETGLDFAPIEAWKTEIFLRTVWH
jgi:hypothetical protein